MRLISLLCLAFAMSTSLLRAEPIRDSAVTRYATGDIRAAWLENETQRYGHFVLGGRWEAATLAVQTAGGRTLRHALPADAVFEDREARIADLDGDGRSEIIAVISRQSVGSSLGLFGVRDGALQLLAETPPNGQPNRWLNPSGIGYFTGAPHREIAIVRMPHLVGRLEIWGFDGQGLTRRFQRDGFSTHRLGSRHQRLFAVVRSRHAPADLLILPSRDRTVLHAIDASDPQNPEKKTWRLPSPADGAFRATALPDGTTRLVVPMENGARHSLIID